MSFTQKKKVKISCFLRKTFLWVKPHAITRSDSILKNIKTHMFISYTAIEESKIWYIIIKAIFVEFYRLTNLFASEMIVTKARKLNQNEQNVCSSFIFYDHLLMEILFVARFLKSSHPSLSLGQTTWTSNSISFTISTSIESH